MYVEFNQLPDTARVWIYQAGRKLSQTEIEDAEILLKEFTQQWSAHGHPLKTSFQVLYGRFIILAADEGYNDVSGCSIDSAVHAIKSVSSKIGVDLLGRNTIIFLKNGQEEEVLAKELKEKYIEGVWNAQSITFNTLAATKKELQNWAVEAHETWLKRYIESAAMASKAL